MRQSLKMFRLGSLAYERAGKLIFVDAYSRVHSGEKYWITDPTILDEFYLFEKQLLESIKDSRIRLVVDSISTLFIQNNAHDMLTFNSNRLKMLRRKGIFTLDCYVNKVLDEQTMFSFAHSYPIIVRMEFQSIEGGLRRTIQIGKMKSGEFQASKQPFTIDPNTGIITYGT